jgi:hypothetical protein
MTVVRIPARISCLGPIRPGAACRAGVISLEAVRGSIIDSEKVLCPESK